MFINRPTRPLPPIGHTDIRKGVDAPDDTDFLTKHGGKVALFGFSFAAALIYRWFIGGKNRTALEEQITLESPLHPYEANDLRVKNSMTTSQFRIFQAKCNEKFSDGYSTYDEFVLLFQQQCVYEINEGYVIDRTILNFINNTSAGRNGRHPVSFFLVALSNVVTASPDDRIMLLFDIAQHLPYNDQSVDVENATT